jgi:hypothetical protein
MSLINDALKRASQLTAPPTKPGAGTPEPPERPLEKKKEPSLWPVIVFPTALLVILGVAGWFILKQAGTESAVNAAARQNPASNAGEGENVAKVAAESSVPEPGTAPEIAAVDLQTGLTPTSNGAATVAPLPPPAPALKLQGIFFKPVQPLAMLNGRTVGVGEKVLNGRITAIRRDSVSVLVDGKTQVLTLPTNN